MQIADCRLKDRRQPSEATTLLLLQSAIFNLQSAIATGGGARMAASFAGLSREMAEARESLRWFTLGRVGFTRRDGLGAIRRVGELCERLLRRFGSGKHAAEVAATVVMARNQILAAKARLAILRRRRAAAAARSTA
jgi:hypothetical protein